MDNGPVIFIAELATVIAGSWLVSELLIRLVTRGAKRAGASADLIRNVREGLVFSGLSSWPRGLSLFWDWGQYFLS